MSILIGESIRGFESSAQNCADPVSVLLDTLMKPSSMKLIGRFSLRKIAGWNRCAQIWTHLSGLRGSVATPKIKKPLGAGTLKDFNTHSYRQNVMKNIRTNRPEYQISEEARQITERLKVLQRNASDEVRQELRSFYMALLST